MGFLSTPSARRATTAPAAHICSTPYFYPRPPRGGRRVGARFVSIDFLFLSTPSARRATPKVCSINFCFLTFLSTPSARRATQYPICCCASSLDFYPRPPRGGRQIEQKSQKRKIAFLSTPSARRATHRPDASIRRQQNFYPRPPRGGRHDCVLFMWATYPFLSTPSARRATCLSCGSKTQ